MQILKTEKLWIKMQKFLTNNGCIGPYNIFLVIKEMHKNELQKTLICSYTLIK